MTDVENIILEYQYIHAFINEKNTIEVLNGWLEAWLYLKNQCPNCGK